MSPLLIERKISHRVLEELGAPEKHIESVLKLGAAAPFAELKKERTKVILRKSDPVPVPQLVDLLHRNEITIFSHTDFFIFAELGQEELNRVAALPEVDRIFLDEKVTAFLEYSVETTKALATWNTFRHYGEGITWAVVDSGINDSHPNFLRSDPSLPRGSYPDWWYPGLEQKDWFRQVQNKVGSPIIIEPGFPDNTVSLRFDLLNERALHPHGTHIAGIVAGGAPSATEEAGVEIPGKPELEKVANIQGLAPKARLVDFRVLESQEAKGDVSDAIRALFLIRKINEEAGRTVIAGANLSLGYPYNPWDFGCGGSPICEEVDRLVQSGVLVVAAAGNAGYGEFQTMQLSETGDKAYMAQPLFSFQSIADPGNAREAITVGSTHRRYPHRWGPSFFSSKGPTGDGRLKPDILAPGEKITSCNVNFHPGANPGDPPCLYMRMSGTSQAAAHVSGALSLFLSIHPEFVGRPFDVKEKLLDSCTDLGRERYHQGQGLLDIFRLVQSV